jgi:hypothetical protein
VPDDDRADWLATDTADRRAALAGALQAALSDRTRHRPGEPPGDEWLELASRAYRWLRNRDSLQATGVKIVPGKPVPEGSIPMATTFDLSDVQSVSFSLAGQDAKGAPVPLAAGFTAAWSLADPDASGATLTASADGTTAELAAGVPDTNLMVSVAVTNPDGSVLNGAEAVIVVASAVATVGIVPGIPTP